MKKKTVIIGATNNAERYAYIAASRLTSAGHQIVPLGIKKGNVFGSDILDINSKPVVADVDTVTMYLGPRHQQDHSDYIRSLHPKRVIFNPGTENSEFQKSLAMDGVEVVEGCTLVMLSTGQY